MLLLVGIVLLVFLPSPWNLAAFGVCLASFGGEVYLWHRTVRGRRVGVGAETLIGRTGTVVSQCRPDGQIRLLGETWEARCVEGADPGETVAVTGRDELRLVVERVEAP